MNIAIILAFGAMLGWGVGDFLIQRSVQRLGNTETLFLINLCSSIILFPFIYKSLFSLSLWEIIMLIILGVVGFFGVSIHFRALNKGKLSVVETIFSLELPLTIILGVSFLKEKLSPALIILMILLLIGIILLSIDFQKISKHDFLEKGALLAITAASMVAVINFLTSVGTKTINPVMVIWFPWLVAGLMSWVCLLRKKKIKATMNAAWSYRQLLIPMIIIDITAWIFYAFALSKKELSITTSITEGFIVIAMFLGIIFNKEKVRPWQYFGAFLAIFSSILIGLLF